MPEMGDYVDDDGDGLVSSHGLSADEKTVLRFTAEKGVTWPGEVGRVRAITPQDASNVLASLKEKGVVKRVYPGKSDGEYTFIDPDTGEKRTEYNGDQRLLKRRKELFQRGVTGGIDQLRQWSLYAIASEIGDRKIVVRTSDGVRRDPVTMEPVDEDELQDFHDLEQDIG